MTVYGEEGYTHDYKKNTLHQRIVLGVSHLVAIPFRRYAARQTASWGQRHVRWHQGKGRLEICHVQLLTIGEEHCFISTPFFFPSLPRSPLSGLSLFLFLYFLTSHLSIPLPRSLEGGKRKKNAFSVSWREFRGFCIIFQESNLHPQRPGATS